MAKDKNRVSIDDMEDDFSKEIPGAVKAKSKIDEWLTGNIVEPLAARGYPNLGAGLATVPSTIAEFLAPTTPGEFAPGMAGVGKMSRKAKKISKDLLKIAKENPGKIEKILDQLYVGKAGELPEIFNNVLPSRLASGKLSELQNYLQSSEYENILNKKNWPMDFSSTNKQIESLTTPFKNLRKTQSSDAINNSSIGKGFKNLIDDFNYDKGYESKRLDLAHKAVFGDKPYLRPKGYANQKSTKLPKQEIMSKEPSRTDYDKMLGGNNPGQGYFDNLTNEWEKHQSKDEDFDLIKQLIDKSWRVK